MTKVMRIFCQLTVANEPDADLTGELGAAEAAVRAVVRVLQPKEVGLDDALWVLLHHAVLAHVDAVLEAELVGHLALGALAQAHAGGREQGREEVQGHPRTLLWLVCNLQFGSG